MPPPFRGEAFFCHAGMPSSAMVCRTAHVHECHSGGILVKPKSLEPELIAVVSDCQYEMENQ